MDRATKFEIGDRVVCKRRPERVVKQWAKKHPSAVFPKNGVTYTVRAVDEWPAATLLRFEELDNSAIKLGDFEGEIEPGFNAEFFARTSQTEAR